MCPPPLGRGYKGVIPSKHQILPGLAEISLVHPSLNRLGGAELYLLRALEALKDAGHKVSLYTLDKTDWRRVSKTFDTWVRPDGEHWLQERPLELEGLHTWLLAATRYLGILHKAKSETRLTINNYGEALPHVAQISIIHSAPLQSRRGNPYRIPQWPLARHLHRAAPKLLGLKTSPLLVTNSHYTLRLLPEELRKQALVLHPPITVAPLNQQKDGRVVAVARITPGKGLQALAALADMLPRVRFTLAGRTGPESARLVSQLQGRHNLELLLNPPRERLLQTLARGSIVLSTQEDEAFGMAVVEGMALGCIPLVCRGGGPWLDVLGGVEGVAGYGYSSLEEAAERIRLILEEEEHRCQLRRNAVERAKEFSLDRFREGIQGLVEEFINQEEWKHPYPQILER